MIGLYIVLIFWFLGLGTGLRGFVEHLRANRIEDIKERNERLIYIWKTWQLPGMVLMGIAMVLFAIEKIIGYVH